MNSNKIKILVCVDGSSYSLNAVRYAGHILAHKNAEIVLFHTMQKVDDTFFDMGIVPIYRSHIVSVEAWRVEQKKAVKKFMNDARQILLNIGYDSELVTVKIQSRKIGIARDILKEAQNGYNAVVVGRRGISRIKDFVLGSVASKLIDRLEHIPLWVVGEKPYDDKLLVGFDGSECSMRAIDYLGYTLGKSGVDIRVTLLNVIRGIHVLEQESYALLDHEYTEIIKETKTNIESSFVDAKNRLVKYDLNPSLLSTQIISEVHSRAATIVEKAEKDRYGTIVVGRRGLSKVEEFFMGRVSNKVIHLARDKAVWIVS